jgi:hypothetical protein
MKFNFLTIITRLSFVFVIGVGLARNIQAANLPALQDYFRQNSEAIYVPRYCGQNVQQLVQGAQSAGIDLSGAYVLKIVGTGFLETSGFYTRTKPQDRSMLGYFHYVLVAENHVFDFDLHELLVLSLEDYIRLQFTPPYLPFRVFGMNYDPAEELKYWKVSRYEVSAVTGGSFTPTWERHLSQFVNLPGILARARVR